MKKIIVLIIVLISLSACKNDEIKDLTLSKPFSSLSYEIDTDIVDVVDIVREYSTKDEDGCIVDSDMIYVHYLVGDKEYSYFVCSNDHGSIYIDDKETFISYPIGTHERLSAYLIQEDQH